MGVSILYSYATRFHILYNIMKKNNAEDNPEATLLFCWKQAQACSTRELSYASGSCENQITCGCGTLCSPIIFSIQTMLYQVSNL